MELLVIGLDGVNSAVLDWMSEADATPTLDTLREGSAVGPLESQLPPWTPSAWPSMYTGVNPGKHGVYDFFTFDGYDHSVVNRSHVNEHALWELLSMHGISSVVVNVPVTHPPREFDGALVPGYIAPEQPQCHPTGTWKELNDQLGSYSLYGSTIDEHPTEDDLADDLVDLTRMRGAAFRYLADNHEPEFGFLQFQTTDTVFHECPGEDSIIERVFETVDSEIRRVLDGYEPTGVLVVSDHGIGPMDGCEFRVNDFLSERGWLATTTDGDGMPSWKSLTRDDDSGTNELLRTAGQTAIRLGSRVGVTSQRVGAVLDRLGLREWVLETVPLDVVRAGAEQVDFPASSAYMRTRTEMGIRINLDGREPSGTVAASEYDAVRDELIDQLSAAETPEGEPIFERVARCEEIFAGPYLDAAPDIVTVPSSFDHFLVANLKGATIGEPTEPWEHKRDGIVIASGPAVEPTAIEDAHLFDIAPTVLSWFGVPISDRMDGEALPFVDIPEQESYPDFDGSSVAGDAEGVADRLEALGYLQ